MEHGSAFEVTPPTPTHTCAGMCNPVSLLEGVARHELAYLCASRLDYEKRYFHVHQTKALQGGALTPPPIEPPACALANHVCPPVPPPPPAAPPPPRLSAAFIHEQGGQRRLFAQALVSQRVPRTPLLGAPISTPGRGMLNLCSLMAR